MKKMTAVAEGKKAPQFALKDKEGTLHSLKSLEAEYLVVFFYPKDDTPGCTVEAKNFEDAARQLKKFGAQVIGISGGNEKTKEKFCTKHGLDSILLLSDPEFATAQAYNSYGEKKFMGRTYNGIFRNTFILDKDRKIIKIYTGVDPKTHSKEVLELFRSLGS